MKTGHVKRSDLPTGCRFDPTFHLSEGIAVRHMLSNMPYPLLRVKDVASRIFIGGRARRVYVTKRENGIPFLSSSDILQADLENVKLASKKYTPDIEGMTLQKGWTLISRSGTIGNCAFATRKHAQKLASEDVIRLVPNNILREGVIYAFLASRYGHSMLTQGTFGAVIQHIEPDFVGSLPIPNFPEDFADKVDALMQEAAELKDEAVDSLKQAHSIIQCSIDKEKIAPTQCVSVKSILSSHNTRFEASYFASNDRAFYNYVTNNFTWKPLSEYTSRIFRPGIFKRQYVTNGVTFLGGADILMAIPKSDKQLSFKQVASMPELMTSKGWILVTCGGTIGNTVLIDGQLEKCAISQHVMRIVPKDTNYSGFLYAFLSSEVGKKLIQMFTYGSVIPSVEAHHLALVPVPDFSSDIVEKVNDLTNEYSEKFEQSKELELKAISMVEAEIEKWNQN